jgi:hypothetical protein
MRPHARPAILPRRTLLRGLLCGAGVSLPLPPLGAMLGGNGEALADGAPLPTFYGTWFWGNATILGELYPSTPGTNWTPTEQLAPLGEATLKPYVSIVGGLNVGGSITPVHNVGACAVLTGSRRITTSLDVVVARSIAGNTPRKALHLALSRPNGGSGFDWISYNEGGTANQGALDPRAVFKALFMESAPAATGAQPATDPTRDARRSVLDAVIKDATPFCASLGVADRQRCDQHLTYVREVERRLAALGAPSPATSAARCKTPTAPAGVTDTMVGKTGYLSKLNRGMAEVIALALACDLTHVFTLMETSTAAHHPLPEVGVNETFHELFHRIGAHPTIRKGIAYKMGLLADLLQILRAMPYATGNLLDRAAVLSTTCVSDGQSHSTSNYPILVAGKAGGKLKGGVYVRASGPVTRAPLTVARAVGAPLTEFGTDSLATKDGLGELAT